MTRYSNTQLKRIIVDYQKINNAIIDLLVEKFPGGYNDSDIICFKNAAGDWIECVEVRTEDTMYLVKVGKRLEIAMDTYDPDDIDESDDEYSDRESDLDELEDNDDEF